MNKKIGLVDGNWMLNRAYSIAGTKSPEAGVTNLFLSMVCKELMLTRCTHHAIFFDGDSVFRYDIYKKYKANRNLAGGSDKMKADRPVYTVSLPYLKEVLSTIGMTWHQSKKYEGDDLINSTAADSEDPVVIFANDKDFFQGLRPGVVMRTNKHGKEPMTVTHDKPELLKSSFKGLTPKSFILYQTIVGDSIDNVPGLPGYGPAKAKAVAMQYSTLNEWYKDADKETRKLMTLHAEQLRLNRKLVTLVADQGKSVSKLDKHAHKRIERPCKALVDYCEFLYPKSKGLF